MCISICYYAQIGILWFLTRENARTINKRYFASPKVLLQVKPISKKGARRQDGVQSSAVIRNSCKHLGICKYRITRGEQGFRTKCQPRKSL